MQEATLEAIDGADWPEDDIDIDVGDDLADLGKQEDNVEHTESADVDTGIFVPPSHGPDPIQQALRKNPQSIGLHVAAGEFQKAIELLQKQLGIHSFDVFKQPFIDTYTMNKMKYQSMPHSQPLDYQLRFIDKPIVTITKSTLQKLFSKGIELTTKGDFSSAILVFRNCLQTVPLLALASEQEQDVVNGLIKRLVEYITAMRIELERKKMLSTSPNETNRITELSCYMTLCGMDNAHKFLVFRNAMNANYKA